MRIVCRKDVYFEIMKSIKNYSNLTKVPVVDKNGHTRMVYKKLNKENNKHMNIPIQIETRDLSNSLDYLHISHTKLDALLNHFENYDLSDKSSNEIFKDIKLLSILNHQADKGYGADQTIGEYVYPIKRDVINKIVESNVKGITIKTDVNTNDEYYTGWYNPDIIYFEKDNEQISFHLKNIPIDEKKKIEKVQQGVGKWNGKPGADFIKDYSSFEYYTKIRTYIDTLHGTAEYIMMNKENRDNFDKKNNIPELSNEKERLEKKLVQEIEKEI